MRRNMGRGLAFGLIAAILGCGGGGDSGGAGGGSSASGAGGGSSASGNASSSAAASSSGTGMTGNACPRVDLGALPITYKGDTSGAMDLVQSSRLEWGAAPDDTLLFTAPAAGTYHIAMTSEPSKNGGCGASIQEFTDVGTSKYYDESSCPATGMVSMIDGVFAASLGSASDFQAAQGQKVLIWVSCATWSDAQMGAYTLTIAKM